MTYKYLASPYTDPDPAVMQRRFEQAERATHWLLVRRIWIYSPIVHCHELAKKNCMPRDASFWKKYNFTMLESSDGLIILTVPGYKESKGVLDELEYAVDHHMTVRWLSPKGILDDYSLSNRD